MADYSEIYNRMQWNIEYTATELNVSGATMTAMANRGLVKKIAAKPCRYAKIENKVAKIMDITKQFADTEYFTLFKRDKELGMYCRIKSGCIVDGWDRVYDVSDVYKMKINHKEFDV